MGSNRADESSDDLAPGTPGTGALILSGVAAAIGGLLYAGASSNSSTAETLATLRVQKIAEIVARAEREGGDGGLVAIRGTAVPLGNPVEVPGVGPCVAVATQRILVSHAVEGPRHELVEKRKSVQGSTDAGPFLVTDATGYAEVTPRGAHELPLTPAPKQFERLENEQNYELTLSRAGIVIEHTNVKERVVGLETLRSVLGVGTVLTVVARAATDARGGLQLSAGVGPFIISRDTLSGLVASHASTGASLRTAAWVVLGIAAAAGAYGLFRKAVASSERKQRYDGNVQASS